MRVNRRSLQFGLSLAVVALFAAGAFLSAADAQFVGAGKCKACHMNEHKVWLESKHAKAMELLKPEEQTKAECIGCHMTGHGKPAAEGADLKGVQCEACHGPGSLYKSMDIMNKGKYAADKAGQHKKALEAGMVVPDEKTCTSCHNAKSPTFKGFDYASAKEKIKHWK